MGRNKIYTEDEARERARRVYNDYQKPKMEADWKRLEGVRIEDDGKILKTKKEKREFKEFVREKNKRRFEEILNDTETWEKINSSSDEWLIRAARQKRKKRNGKWVNDKEVQRATDIIYGSMTGSIIEEEPEEQYKNPYNTNEYEQ